MNVRADTGTGVNPNWASARGVRDRRRSLHHPRLGASCLVALRGGGLVDFTYRRPLLSPFLQSAEAVAWSSRRSAAPGMELLACYAVLDRMSLAEGAHGIGPLRLTSPFPPIATDRQ